MIDLKKSASNFQVSLKKSGVEKMPEMEMGVIMDVSYSFKDEHEDGLTNTLLTRFVPWGLTFDPDRKVDLFTFSNGSTPAHLVGSVDEGNYVDYIPRHVIGKVPGWGKGTAYAPVTKMVLQHFGWLPGGAVQSSVGFLGGLFGKKKTTVASAEKRRAIVFFVTDGVNEDPAEMKAVMADAETNKYEVFFVLVGVSNQNEPFHLLRELGARYNNAIFREIKDIKGFGRKSDDEINEFFLDPKLVAWLKK